MSSTVLTSGYMIGHKCVFNVINTKLHAENYKSLDINFYELHIPSLKKEEDIRSFSNELIEYARFLLQIAEDIKQ